MFTVRPNVFETNSSSEHCLTVEDGMRDIEEFPVPDEFGELRIPLPRCADDLKKTDNFIQLVQYIVLEATCGGGYSELVKLETENVNKLFAVIQLAYKMAGLNDVESVVFEPPPNFDHGLVMYPDTIEVWDFCDTELSTLGGGIDDALEHLAYAVMQHGSAMTLVTNCPGCKGNNKILNYAAAALALNTHGYFSEC